MVLRYNPPIISSSPFCNYERIKLFESFHDTEPSILEFQKVFLTGMLLFGSDKFEGTLNRKILQSIITFLKCPSRFERPGTN